MVAPKLISVMDLLPLEAVKEMKYDKFFGEEYLSISTGLFVSDKAEWMVIPSFVELIRVIESRGAKRGENYIMYSYQKNLWNICLVVDKLYVSSEDLVDE